MKAADLPDYYNVCSILEHNLVARANKVALVSETTSMTFKEVSEQVNKVGNALRSSGVRFGDCIGILSPDKAEWVTTFFGITKIGGVALGMNTLLKGPSTITFCATRGCALLWSTKVFLSF